MTKTSSYHCKNPKSILRSILFKQKMQNRYQNPNFFIIDLMIHQKGITEYNNLSFKPIFLSLFLIVSQSPSFFTITRRFYSQNILATILQSNSKQLTEFLPFLHLIVVFFFNGDLCSRQKGQLAWRAADEQEWSRSGLRRSSEGGLASADDCLRSIEN